MVLTAVHWRQGRYCDISSEVERVGRHGEARALVEKKKRGPGGPRSARGSKKEGLLPREEKIRVNETKPKKGRGAATYTRTREKQRTHGSEGLEGRKKIPT